MHKFLRTAILITFGMFIICIAGGCGDNPPEEVTDPPQEEVMDPPQEDYVGPASATEVVMDPPSRTNAGRVLYVSSNTEFTLTFNEEVVAVTVNGTSATGLGLNWKWSAQPYLPYGSVKLKIEWQNRDGSKDFRIMGPYKVEDRDPDPPEIMSSTVVDGSNDVAPAVINAGIRIDFNEDVTGTIKLTDEVGADLNWIGAVAGQTATLIPVAGQEAVNETTYKIEIDVQDGAGLPLQVTITFVTKPK
ncbi:hypothetical protein F4X33_05040 [Candidatus Poribacteria bacterium]|nr:hypothetical protein [Candidatus Poribacteria bacterium]